MGAADLRNLLQVSGRRDDCSQGGAAEWLEDKSGSLAVRGADGLLKFLGILLAAVVAAVGAIEFAAVAIRHADVRELLHHGQVHLAALAVAGDRQRSQG